MRRVAKSALTILISTAAVLWTACPIFADASIGRTPSLADLFAGSAKADGTVTALPGLSLANADNLKLNLTYAFHVAKGDAGQSVADLSTYGFNSTAKLGANSSLRSMFYISTPEQKGAQPRLKSDNLIVQQGEFGFGKTKFTLGYQNVGKDFSGFAALQAAGAAPGDVLAQLAKETGMKRMNIGMAYAGGAVNTDLQMQSISDGNGAIERRSAKFSGAKYSLSLMDQTIDQSFGKLAMLAPSERAEFNNELGMHRTGLAGTLKMGLGDFALGFSRVTDQNGASIVKQSLGLTGKKFSVKANFTDIDQNFTRFADLTDANRAAMAPDQGFRRMDLTTGLQLSKTMALETFYSTANNATSKLAREQLRNQLSYTTGFGAKISLFRDQFSSTGADGKSTGYTHQWIKVDHKLALLGGLLLNGLHDTNTMLDPTGKQVTATVDQMHLESDKSKRAWAAVDRNMVDFGNGKIENTEALNLASKLSKRLSMTGRLATIDRGQDGSEQDRAYGMQMSLTRRMNFAADMVENNGAKTGLTAKRVYSLSGVVADRFALFQNIKLNAARSSEENVGSPSKETSAIKMESNVFKGTFAAEMSSSKMPDGNDPFSRGFAFTSDRDAKKKLHFDLVYKTRDLGPGSAFAVRRYNFDYKLSANTSFVFTQFTRQENPDSTINPIGGKVIKLSTMVRQFSVAASFKQDQNFQTATDQQNLGLSLSGKLGSGALVEVGYSLDDLSAPGGGSKAHTFRVKYDRKVDADHFVTLATTYTMVENPNPAVRDNLEGRIDFRTLFN